MVTTILQAVCVLLVNLTGHDDFETRDHATEALKALRPYSYPALIEGWQSADPEIRYRCKSLIRDIKPELIKTWLDSKTAFPYIDAHPSEKFTYRCVGHYAYVQRSMQNAKLDGYQNRKYPENWPEYRRATRLWMQEQLEIDNITFKEADALLEGMWQTEFRTHAAPALQSSVTPWDDSIEIFIKLHSKK